MQSRVEGVAVSRTVTRHGRIMKHIARTGARFRPPFSLAAAPAAPGAGPGQFRAAGGADQPRDPRRALTCLSGHRAARHRRDRHHPQRSTGSGRPSRCRRRARELILLFPEWLPGNHGPRGPLNLLADIRFEAGGKPLAWTRDPVEVYAFHIAPARRRAAKSPRASSTPRRCRATRGASR